MEKPLFAREFNKLQAYAFKQSGSWDSIIWSYQNYSQTRFSWQRM